MLTSRQASRACFFGSGQSSQEMAQVKPRVEKCSMICTIFFIVHHSLTLWAEEIAERPSDRRTSSTASPPPCPSP